MILFTTVSIAATGNNSTPVRTSVHKTLLTSCDQCRYALALNTHRDYTPDVTLVAADSPSSTLFNTQVSISYDSQFH